MVRSSRRAGQSGFSFIEILVVMGIISVLVSMVVVVVPFIREKGKQTKSVDNVRSMLQFYIGSGAGMDKPWPKYNGKDFVLWLVATNKISRTSDENLSILFSPGDEYYTYPGKDPYKSLLLPVLGVGNQDLLKLTSYAGRRNKEKDHILSSAAQQDNAICICDDDDGDVHHKNGIVVGYVSGSAKFLEWSDLGLPEPSDLKHPSFLGDNAQSEELKHMSSGN